MIRNIEFSTIEFPTIELNINIQFKALYENSILQKCIHSFYYILRDGATSFRTILFFKFDRIPIGATFIKDIWNSWHVMNGNRVCTSTHCQWKKNSQRSKLIFVVAYSAAHRFLEVNEKIWIVNKKPNETCNAAANFISAETSHAHLSYQMNLKESNISTRRYVLARVVTTSFVVQLCAMWSQVTNETLRIVHVPGKIPQIKCRCCVIIKQIRTWVQAIKVSLTNLKKIIEIS